MSLRGPGGDEAISRDCFASYSSDECIRIARNDNAEFASKLVSLVDVRPSKLEWLLERGLKILIFLASSFATGKRNTKTSFLPVGSATRQAILRDTVWRIVSKLDALKGKLGFLPNFELRPTSTEASIDNDKQIRNLVNVRRCSMSRMIEVIYEDEVLKPLVPIEGLKKHERTWVILCPRPKKKALHELVGTLTHKEAEEMQKLIDAEFEKIEGEW